MPCQPGQLLKYLNVVRCGENTIEKPQRPATSPAATLECSVISVANSRQTTELRPNVPRYVAITPNSSTSQSFQVAPSPSRQIPKTLKIRRLIGKHAVTAVSVGVAQKQKSYRIFKLQTSGKDQLERPNHHTTISTRPVEIRRIPQSSKELPH